MATKEKKKTSLGFGIAVMFAVTLGMGTAGRLFMEINKAPLEETAVEEAVVDGNLSERFSKEEFMEEFNLGEFEDILILPDQNIDAVKKAAIRIRDYADCELSFEMEDLDLINEVRAFARQLSTGRKKIKVVEGEYDDYHTITLMANRVIVDSIPVEVLRGYVEGDMTLEELNPEKDFLEPIVSGTFYIW